MFNVAHLTGGMGAGHRRFALSGTIHPEKQIIRGSSRSERSTALFRNYTFGLLLAVFAAQGAYATEGVITELLPECPYFVVKTVEGYAVMEWNGEAKPDRNDHLLGSFSAGAMQLFENASKGGNVKVWVEGYPLPYDEAMSIYRSECQ